MKLLILGGTRFLGRHLAEQATAAGHALTLLHRGRSAGAALFPRARHVIAERDGGLHALDGLGPWDAVIDTSGYLPRVVAASARALRERVGRYLFVSTISVYAPLPREGGDEGSPLLALAAPTEQIDGETYGPLKALCEAEVERALPGRSLVARPGLIVGPHDPTGRFTWWPQRMAAGGEVLVPDAGERPVQWIDARDLAAWLLRQAQDGTTGVFNLTGPEQPVSFARFFERLRDSVGQGAMLCPVGEGFLLGQGVAPWSELPLWLPEDLQGLHRVDVSRALASGLHCRPLEETARDTLAWAEGEPGVTASTGMARTRPGLEPTKELALLQAWRQSSAAPPKV